MKYYLINVLNEKEECTEFEVIQFLTDRQIALLHNFQKSNKNKIRFTINFNVNMVYKYILIERGVKS